MARVRRVLGLTAPGPSHQEVAGDRGLVLRHLVVLCINPLTASWFHVILLELISFCGEAPVLDGIVGGVDCGFVRLPGGRGGFILRGEPVGK